MPTIPPMSLEEDAVSPNEIYSSPNGDGSLYDPAQPNSSLEALNGGLDLGNLKQDVSIEPWMVQIGTFARGAYWGTDRWEFMYASQMDTAWTTDEGDQISHSRTRITSASLSQSVFIPFSAQVVLYGYQAFFRAESTRWDSDGTPLNEWWDGHVAVNNSVIDTHRVLLAHGRCEPGAPDATLATTAAVTLQTEEKFRWVEKSGMYTGHDGPGYFKFQVDIGAKVKSPDQNKAECIIPTAAAWILALR